MLRLSVYFGHIASKISTKNTLKYSTDHLIYCVSNNNNKSENDGYNGIDIGFITISIIQLYPGATPVSFACPLSLKRIPM